MHADLRVSNRPKPRNPARLDPGPMGKLQSGGQGMGQQRAAEQWSGPRADQPATNGNSLHMKPSRALYIEYLHLHEAVDKSASEVNQLVLCFWRNGLSSQFPAFATSRSPEPLHYPSNPTSCGRKTTRKLFCP